jgi:peroxiredoxin Q/BCP
MPLSLKRPIAAAALVAVLGSALAAQSAPTQPAPASSAAAPTTPAPAGGPQIGEMAPDFALPFATKTGPGEAPVRLSDLRGRVVVIAFYPKARTRGCTAQMEAYREQWATVFKGGEGVALLAISTDDVATLHDWAKEREYPATFVSDTAASLGAVYDVKYPAVNMLRRVLFVIGPDGKVVHIMRPFRELSADSYTELSDAIRRAGGG